MRLGKDYLLIRADANTQIGTGHLMRCLALGQAWQDRGGQVVFITACDSDELRKRLAGEGFDVFDVRQPHPDPADWEASSRILRSHPGAWVVLDGYHFDSSYQRRVKEMGHRLLVIDDMAHLDYYYADIVLNQNLHAEDLQYSCESHTRLLLGTKYVLLRREFLKWRGWKREIPDVASKVLVTMGGGDPDNVTLKVIRALDMVDLEELEVAVVVGPSNPHLLALEAAARESRHRVRIVRQVFDMPNLMAWADVAVSAAGSTCWELAFMGLPGVVLSVAGNQQGIGQALLKEGVISFLGTHEEVDEQAIASAVGEILEDSTSRWYMIRRAQKLVDGRGQLRVIELLIHTVESGMVLL